MTRALRFVCLLAVTAAPAFAQATKTPPAKPETKAPANAPATKAADTKGAATKAADTKGASAKAPQTKQAAAPPAAPAPPKVETPTIMREVFSYEREGRRDPFVSLLTSSDLRPTVADLRLTSILYDENGSSSTAVMRDLVTDEQYRVSAGQTLGRMKVALIKRNAVIFSITEFGLNRQDSLVLGDTTKARAK